MRRHKYADENNIYRKKHKTIIKKYDNKKHDSFFLRDFIFGRSEVAASRRCRDMTLHK